MTQKGKHCAGVGSQDSVKSFIVTVLLHETKVLQRFHSEKECHEMHAVLVSTATCVEPSLFSFCEPWTGTARHSHSMAAATVRWQG